MKKLNSVSLCVLAATAVALTVSACGKGGDSPQTQSPQEQHAATASGPVNSTPPQPQASPPTVATGKIDAKVNPAVINLAPVANIPFTLTESYLGTNLTLIYPHPRNWGYIGIKDDDAKALYYALAVKATKNKGNLEWLPSYEKHGYNVTCFDQVRKTSPSKHEFACSLYIDYQAGKVVQNLDRIKVDKKISELKQSYFGKNLVMVAPHPAYFSVIDLKGEDARALFFTMDVCNSQPEGNLVWLPSIKKHGQDITCVEQARRDSPDNKEYSCSLYFSDRTGAIIPPGSN